METYAPETCLQIKHCLSTGAHYKSKYLISQGGEEVNQGLYITMQQIICTLLPLSYTGTRA